MCTVRHRSWQQPSWALQVCQAAERNVCPPCSPAGVPEQSCLGDCSWDLQETHSCPVCKMRAPQLSQRDVWGSRDSFVSPPPPLLMPLPFLLLSLSAAPLCRWRRWQTQHPSSPPVTMEPVGGVAFLVHLLCLMVMCHRGQEWWFRIWVKICRTHEASPRHTAFYLLPPSVCRGDPELWRPEGSLSQTHRVP